jgi:hypothetical protein
MPRIRTALLAALAGFAMAAAPGAAIAKPHAPQCEARVTRALGDVARHEPQTLVVQTFGACADPLLVIWIDRPAGRVQQLHFARLSAHERRARTPRTVRAAVRRVMAQIASKKASAFETWAELQASGESGGGWHGTRLSQPDYERITASASHVLLVPTDATRAKLVAWDGENEEWADVVYYGD